MLNKAYGAPVAFCAGRCSHGRRRRKPLAGCSDFLRGHLKTSKDAPKTSKTHHRISASFWNCRYFEGTAAQNETESVSFFGLYLCCRRKMCQFQWFYVFFFWFLGHVVTSGGPRAKVAVGIRPWHWQRDGLHPPCSPGPKWRMWWRFFLAIKKSEKIRRTFRT